MEILVMIMFCIGIVGVLIGTVILIKSNNTLNKRLAILDAICEYNLDIINGRAIGPKVSYDDMEDYNKTLFRFWDWGYKRILPRDKYELIKGYIDKE